MLARTVLPLTVLCLLLAGLQGCGSSVGDDVDLVLAQLNKKDLGPFLKFGTGTLAGGRALLLTQKDAAFWVKDGIAYAVNENAMSLAPDMPAAPAEITYQVVYDVVDAKPGEQNPGDEAMEYTSSIMSAMKMTAMDASEAEAALAANPDDIITRRLLLAYYMRERFNSPDLRRKHENMALWFIENHPRDPVAGAPEAGLDPILGGDAYGRAMALWKEHIQRNPSDLTILDHASSFATVHDFLFAEECLKKCVALEPENSAWHEKLGTLYALHSDEPTPAGDITYAQKSLAETNLAMELVGTSQGRVSLLEEAASRAYGAGVYDEAKAYAEELLASVEKLEGWDQGNGWHYAHIVLGRLALRDGNLVSAREHLIAAGKTKGSPQLNSFGPSMSLAKELLEKGETETVLKYLDLCTAFWDDSCRVAITGEDSITQWKREIAAGRVPHFGARLD